MFTPLRRVPSTEGSPIPKTEAKMATGFRRPTTSEKGKAVAYVDGPPEPSPAPAPPPPPLISLDEGRVRRPTKAALVGYDSGNSEDWRRFKEAGLLDAEVLERKDRDALLQKISRLKQELFDHQYNMGLLLMENKDLSSNCEELTRGVAEAQEILKREQARNVISFCEAEERLENTSRALDHEKQRVRELEMTLWETGTDLEQLKDDTGRAEADADAHRARIEAKRQDVEVKLNSANEKYAEADMKLSKLERQMQELETREDLLKSERTSLTVEKKAHDDTFHEKKEDLLELERKLQQLEQRQCEHKRILREREENLNLLEETCERKESELEQMAENIDSANLSLKDMENHVSNRLSELDSKEEKHDATRRNIEFREKQILALEQKLSSRERVEIQNILDQRWTLLDAEMRDFELDLQQKRNMVDEELRTKNLAVERKEIEISHLEAKLKIRVEALDKKLEKINVKEGELEGKMKTCEEKSKNIESEEKELVVIDKQVVAEEETLLMLKDDIQRLMDEIKEKEMQVHEENEKCKIAEEKRTEHLRLVKHLKHEVGSRHQNELFLKENEDLKRDKLRFEKDWVALNDKKATVNGELQKIEKEKLMLESLQSSEEQRLKEERIKMEDKNAKEMEEAILRKESFGEKMKHDRLAFAEKAQKEHIKMVQHFELMRRELEDNMRKMQEELEEEFHQREKVWGEKRLEEIRNINLLKEVAEKRKEEIESFKVHMVTEKQELALERKLFEEEQLEINKDICTMGILTQKLKDEREKLVNERSSFLTLVEKVKCCKKCGDFIRESVLPDLLIVKGDDSPSFLALYNKVLHRFEDFDNIDRSSVPMNVRSHDAGRHMSLLRKCASSIHKWLPQKRVGDSSNVGASPNCGLDLPGDEKYGAFPMTNSSVHGETRAQLYANFGTGPSLEIVNHSDVKNVRLNTTMTESQSHDSPSGNNLSNACSELQEVTDDSQLSGLPSVKRKLKGKCKAGTYRKHSIKAVVVDAEADLGETSQSMELKVDKLRGDEVLESLSQSDKVVVSRARKRSHARVTRSTENGQDVDYSEGHTDGNAGGHKKRRQTMSLASQPLGETRYNLRHHRKIPDSVTTVQNLTSEHKDGDAAGGDVGEANQTIPCPANTLSLYADVNSGHGERAESMPFPVKGDVKISSDSIVGLTLTLNAGDGNAYGATFVENVLVHRDVVANPETVDDDDECNLLDNDSSSNHVDEGDIDVDDEEGTDYYSAPASIGKQIWNFFTT